MVSDALRKKLMPFVALEYASQGEVTLDERLYVEHYPAFYEVGLNRAFVDGGVSCSVVRTAVGPEIHALSFRGSAPKQCPSCLL